MFVPLFPSSVFRTFLFSFLFIPHLSANCTATNTTTPAASKCCQQLSTNYYAMSCPLLDQLVGSVTVRRFKEEPLSGPATIRLFFTDCFVEGCDASILISSKPGEPAERDAPDNRELAPQGFETITQAKELVETKCPGVVSCADILAIAARDFVHLEKTNKDILELNRSIMFKSHEKPILFSLVKPMSRVCIYYAGGPYYEVKKGRWDGTTSMASRVHSNLPRANSTLSDIIELFASKGLNITDLVVLSGAHSIGFAHCDSFLGRLYDFRGSGEPDPDMDPKLLSALREYCPPQGGNDDVAVPLDVTTPFKFDNAYYANLQANMGLLATDQALLLDPRTRDLVGDLGRDKGRFLREFAGAMEKLGSIGVKRGSGHAEIRKNCSVHIL